MVEVIMALIGWACGGLSAYIVMSDRIDKYKRLADREMTIAKRLGVENARQRSEIEGLRLVVERYEDQ